MTKMTTANWRDVMKSSEALRQIERLMHDLSPDHRVKLVGGVAALAKEYGELEEMGGKR